MNSILNQSADITFIEQHKNDSLNEIALLLSKQPTLNKDFIIAQINGLQKAKNKIPQFYNTPNITYPTKLSLEQCSSEITGIYKSQLINGKTLVDLTGGFGVDSFYFSKEFKAVTHIEQNTDLHLLVKHNFNALKADNITLVNTTAEEFIENNTQQFDVIYIDPSRRNENQRVFKISILKEKFVGPHWKSIDVLEYDKDEITKNDLLICDGASFLSKVHSPNMENREDYIKELNEHPYVIVVDPERIEEILDWTDYLKIHSESFRPEKFPKNLLAKIFGFEVKEPFEADKGAENIDANDIDISLEK